MAELWHFGTVRNTPFLRLVPPIPLQRRQRRKADAGRTWERPKDTGTAALILPPSLLNHFAFEAFHDLFFQAGYVGLGNAKEGGYLFLGHFLAVGGVEAEP